MTTVRASLRLPFKGDGLTRAGLAVLVALVIVGLLGRLFGLGGDPTAFVGPRLATPSWDYPFGTDSLGRSMLPRVIDGIGTTFVLSTGAVLITIVVGVVVGLLAGLPRRVLRRGRRAPRRHPVLVSRRAVGDPRGGDPRTRRLLGDGRRRARHVAADGARRAQLRHAPWRGRDFVVSAEISGASTRRIVVTQLLPNISGPVVVQATYAISVAMLVESAVSFLGLGVQPPAASLGSLMQEGSFYLTVAPWLTVFPGIVLALAILSVNLLGDGLRDRFEPRPVRRLT